MPLTSDTRHLLTAGPESRMRRLKARLRELRRFGRNRASDKPCFVSMVVDDNPFHPYQAETLLFTLEKYAGVPRSRMVVQCTDRVADSVRAEFASNGYSVVVISPYLDGKYCNKIRQLDYFLERKFDGARGVFLLDLDFVVLAPLEVKERELRLGKDRRWSPILLCRSSTGSLRDAGVEHSRASCPAIGAPGDTVSTNFNGGFLYIPLPLRFARVPAARMAKSGPSSCMPDPNSSSTLPNACNTDQIAFAMGLADSACIPYRHTCPRTGTFPCTAPTCRRASGPRSRCTGPALPPAPRRFRLDRSRVRFELPCNRARR